MTITQSSNCTLTSVLESVYRMCQWLEEDQPITGHRQILIYASVNPWRETRGLIDTKLALNGKCERLG